MRLSLYGWVCRALFLKLFHSEFLGLICIMHLSFFFSQLRNPKDVTTEEYNEFYKNTFKEYLDPLASSHFTTEVTFWVILKQYDGMVWGRYMIDWFFCIWLPWTSFQFTPNVKFGGYEPSNFALARQWSGQLNCIFGVVCSLCGRIHFISCNFWEHKCRLLSIISSVIYIVEHVLCSYSLIGKNILIYLYVVHLNINIYIV